jgi:ABC-2 type transport system ATP-binding protein
MTAVVATQDLRKTYGDVVALDGVTLDIQAGEVFSLLGPNGAGKTTLVEILEGYRRASSGTAIVLGVDPATGNSAWKARVGIVLQDPGPFNKLTVEELITHFAGFYPDPEPVGKVMDLVGIAEKRRARCDTLSGGQRRRVDVALGIIGNPDLIFLDEPTTGFDPAARRHAWDMIRGLSALGKTILLTTHYLDEAEELADRVGVIMNGRIIALGAPDEIGGEARNVATVSVWLTGALQGVATPRLSWPVETDSRSLRVKTTTPTAAVGELTDWAGQFGLGELPGLTVSRPSLEEVYLAMIGDSHATPDGELGI